MEAYSQDLNFYDILEVSHDATLSQIKKAYRSLVLKFHPDVNKAEKNGHAFKKISKAYLVLKDGKLREEYNRHIGNNEKYFFKITNFKYYFKKFFKKTTKVIDGFDFLFKNISGKNGVVNIDNNELNLSILNISVPNEILKLSVNELEERLMYSQNKYVRLNAVLALGCKREKKVYSILEKYILDTDSDVRKSIIWAIGNLRMKKSLNVLKILYTSSQRKYLLNMLFAVYKITEGKGDFFYKLIIDGINSSNEVIQIKTLQLLVMSKRKIFLRDIKPLINNISDDVKDLVEQLIEQKRVVSEGIDLSLGRLS